MLKRELLGTDLVGLGETLAQTTSSRYHHSSARGSIARLAQQRRRKIVASARSRLTSLRARSGTGRRRIVALDIASSGRTAALAGRGAQLAENRLCARGGPRLVDQNRLPKTTLRSGLLAVPIGLVGVVARVHGADSGIGNGSASVRALVVGVGSNWIFVRVFDGGLCDEVV